VLVPKKALAEINALLNSSAVERVTFAKDASTLFFTVGARLFTSRQLTGNFPKYEAVLPRDLDKSVEVPAAQLSQAVQRVSQFSDERSNSVRLHMEKNQLRVSLETSYGGDPLVIGFNSRYVLDFLKVAGGGNVRFHFKASDAPGEFRTDPTSDGDCDYNYRYIVMPVRS
jgi:DNA polymerase-3 subunit beta